MSTKLDGHKVKAIKYQSNEGSFHTHNVECLAQLVSQKHTTALNTSVTHPAVEVGQSVTFCALPSLPFEAAGYPQSDRLSQQ
jgi:hypothetical protein